MSQQTTKGKIDKHQLAMKVSKKKEKEKAPARILNRPITVYKFDEESKDWLSIKDQYFLDFDNDGKKLTAKGEEQAESFRVAIVASITDNIFGGEQFKDLSLYCGKVWAASKAAILSDSSAEPSQELTESKVDVSKSKEKEKRDKTEKGSDEEEEEGEDEDEREDEEEEDELGEKAKGDGTKKKEKERPKIDESVSHATYVRSITGRLRTGEWSSIVVEIDKKLALKDDEVVQAKKGDAKRKKESKGNKNASHIAFVPKMMWQQRVDVLDEVTKNITNGTIRLSPTQDDDDEDEPTTTNSGMKATIDEEPEKDWQYYEQEKKKKNIQFTQATKQATDNKRQVLETLKGLKEAAQAEADKVGEFHSGKSKSNKSGQ
jgi:hypothetical protein